jgi:hypothetical protein
MNLKRILNASKLFAEPTNKRASRVVGNLVARDPEVARFLASGMLRYLDCRRGGNCYCGKSIEERETVTADGSLIPVLTLSLKHWQATEEEGRAKAIAQIREQWPVGYLVSDEVAAESGASDDAIALLCQLVDQSTEAARHPPDEALAERQP